ncbi:hypothetical protein HOH87_01365 [bacterium]|nr:hypothetical protein [bacterium]
MIESGLNIPLENLKRFDMTSDMHVFTNLLGKGSAVLMSPTNRKNQQDVFNLIVNTVRD